MVVKMVVRPIAKLSELVDQLEAVDRMQLLTIRR